ncbi:MAG: hypothetical protein KDA45_02395 [Planctomycetales bacterium]|nr:hypothetical protein [Planctomycetales bacterium]
MPPSAPNATVYTARRLPPGPTLTLDGHGGDEAWQRAEVLTDFSFPWSTQSPPATAFRALWNERQLYFRFDASDSDVVLAEGADAMAKVVGSDRVEIFFSSGPELNPYYGLELDPRGEVLSYEARYHRQMNWDWTCPGLVVKTWQHPDGYVVEGSIPSETLRQLGCLHRDAEGDYLIAGLYRAEFSHSPAGGPVIENWMSWLDPQVEQPDFHVPGSFGTIRWSA